MDWNKLDKQIVENPKYIFFKKHRQLFIFIQGFIVIGLLFGILLFVIQDRGIKEQIRDNCGYTSDNYECICEQKYVKNWKNLKIGKEFELESFNTSTTQQVYEEIKEKGMLKVVKGSDLQIVTPAIKAKLEQANE